MKRVLTLVLLVCFCAASAAPQAAQSGLSKDDRKYLVDYIQKSGDNLHKAVKDLNDEQWRFKPAPDKWSVAEVVEHIAKTEDFFHQLVTENVLAKEATPEKKKATRADDEKIIAGVTDRSKPAQAPDLLRPTGEWTNKAEAMKAYEAAHAKLLELAKTTDKDLRAYFTPFGPMGDTDAYQILIYNSGHTARHTKQIEEVKANANFPKK